MASLSKDGSGWRILFVCPATKKRRTIRTGKCAKKNAETTRNMIERLVEAKSLGMPIDQQAAVWLDSIDGKIRERLARAGLAESTKAVSLEEYLDGFIDQRVRRGDVKECTVVSWGHTRRNLIEFFGADRMIGSITSAEADEWAAWLAGHEQLAENTVRKRSANAKMFFRAAARRKQIATNPFEGLVGSVIPSRGRQYFIPRESVTALLDQCRGPEFRLLLLFARYMGCRIPSEIVPLPTRVAALAGDDTAALLGRLIVGIEQADPSGAGLTTKEIERMTFGPDSDDADHEALFEAVTEICGDTFNGHKFGRRVRGLSGRVCKGRFIEGDSAGGGVKRWRVRSAQSGFGGSGGAKSARSPSEPELSGNESDTADEHNTSPSRDRPETNPPHQRNPPDALETRSSEDWGEL